MADVYKLQPNHHYRIRTGQIKSGSQILASDYDDLLLIVVFDDDGNFQEVFERKFTPTLGGLDSEETLENWLADLGFREEPIHVKQFKLSDYRVGIDELTEDFKYFLDNSSEFSDTERMDYVKTIEHWKLNSQFVFWWGNDFWCDKDGFIIAS